jgi:hypothetical protein
MQDHGVLSLLGVEGKSWETFSRFASCTFCITHFPDSKIPTSNALQGECQCTTVQLWKWQLHCWSMRLRLQRLLMQMGCCPVIMA